MKNSLIYKLCFYRFGEVRTRQDQESGFDTVRNAVIGRKNFDLTYFRESYSSMRWLVRIYEVLPLPNRAPKFKVKSTIKAPNTPSNLKVMKRPKF